MSDDKVQSALALLRRGLTLGEAASQLGYKKPETLGQLLRRRGFSYEVANHTVDLVWGEVKDQPEENAMAKPGIRS